MAGVLALAGCGQKGPLESAQRSAAEAARRPAPASPFGAAYDDPVRRPRQDP